MAGIGPGQRFGHFRHPTRAARWSRLGGLFSRGGQGSACLSSRALGELGDELVPVLAIHPGSVAGTLVIGSSVPSELYSELGEVTRPKQRP